MDKDTDLGGAREAFPPTRCALVQQAASPDPAVRQRALEQLIEAYWKPVYKYIRLRWQPTNEDAKDLTQAFFARALEKGFFDHFDPSRARFRTFVRTCVDAFVANERRAAGRLKRGGGWTPVPLDFDAAESELARQRATVGPDGEDFFRQEWVRSLFALAVEDLRQDCARADRGVAFAVFERYDLQDADGSAGLSYARLAEEFGLTVSQVTNALASMRRQFRLRLLERLRASTGSEEEYKEEVARLFGGPAG
jgi:RNA polymerase sigma factor (sigma-70 family)